MSTALKIYIRTLRDGQGISQQQLADYIGMSLRGYTDWERPTGKTKTIKAHLLEKAAAFLHANDEHIRQLSVEGSYLTDEDALRMATEILNPEQAQRAIRLAVEASDEKRARVLALYERLQDQKRDGEWLGIGELLLGDQE